MFPYGDSRITRYILIVFFLLVIGYGLFEARGLLVGPTISISNGVTETSTQFVKIEGKAERIASLSMNGTAISVTESGNFSEPFLLAPGLNTIILNAKDKYGNSTTRAVQIVYNPEKRAGGVTAATATVPLN